MSLAPGTRLGPYEIAAQIGAGGMGEVYRAHDSRLDRDLAIKVLPAAMASDPEMRERFEREARAIAALNHPNIVTIYSVEEVDGVRFLTMELVEGKALDGLSRGFQVRVLPGAANRPAGKRRHSLYDLSERRSDGQ